MRLAIPAGVLLPQGLQMLNRYVRSGECIRCGQCCTNEDCEHFEMGEPATCLIHERERPLRCAEFPANPPILFEGCGYYFLDTWEDNKIVKRHL